MSKESSASSGIGFVGLLTIAFIVLKLVGAIDWSWWWVLSPLWIGYVIVLICFIVLWVCNCNAKRKIKRLLK